MSSLFSYIACKAGCQCSNIYRICEGENYICNSIIKNILCDIFLIFIFNIILTSRNIPLSNGLYPKGEGVECGPVKI